MKNYLSFLLLLISSAAAFGQNDSLIFTNASWKKEVLGDGIFWKHHHFAENRPFNANQYISLIEIAKKAAQAELSIGYSDSLEKTSAICGRYGAIAGINGSYFKMTWPDPDHPLAGKGNLKTNSSYSGNRSIVYLRAADSVISENRYAGDSLRRRHQQGVIAIEKGNLNIYSTDAANLNWEHSIQADDVIATGPVMLLGGRMGPIPNDDFCNDRHPRTAVGKRSDGTVLLVTIDGRTPQSAGMSIKELQQVMRWLGCVEAINLDGGGSTTMFVNGQPENGVVNHPSDNKRFDHAGERPVANVLLVLPTKIKNPR